ncbi:MAG: hypothetical protein OXJ53_02265 [Gammaproteobacteria bacterium]|nr:hypothetical protein [Gammaproteobacteria bacterium]MDE0273566.1 hypothetical protein [Gammaproteobacteria bacterium]
MTALTMALTDLRLGGITLMFGTVAGRVLSETIAPTQQDIWINEEITGKDRHFSISGRNVPLLKGHRVTIVSVCAMRRGKQAGQMPNVLLVNHDADEAWVVHDGADIWSVTRNRPIEKLVQIAASLVAPLFFVIGMWIEELVLGILCCAAILVPYYYRRFCIHRPAPSLIDAHLGELRKAVLRSHPAD